RSAGGRRVRVRMWADADPGVQCRDALDLAVGEREIEDRGILGDALSARRLRADDVPELDMPGEHDLGGALASLPPDLCEERLLERRRATEGAPRLGDDAVLGVQS